MNTPGWHRYIGDRGITSEEKAKDYIEERYLSSYSQYDYGNYVVELKDSSIPIGTCGLYKRSNLGHPDIGYALLPEYEKQGYAFEAASGLLEYAAESWNIRQLYAITAMNNGASIGLLRRLGFKDAGTTRMENGKEDLLLFETHFI